MLHAALSRRRVMQYLAAGALLPLQARAALDPMMTLHRDPDCTCCGGWASYLETHGIRHRSVWASDLQNVRQRLGVPADLAGCHTAEAEGYVLEGHVPVAAIRRLWRERPRAIGLAVPGMPAGSPGMGGEPETYEVILFSPTQRRTYMRFKGDQQV